MLREALDLRRRLVGPAHPLVAAGLLPLGQCLAAQGRVAEARAAWEEALPMAVAGGQGTLVARLRAELARGRSASP